jgi:hypothetical protein
MKRPAAAKGSKAAPAGAPGADRFALLFDVRFQHGFYNDADGRCPDLKAVPTPACAEAMRALGMLFRDGRSGFGVFIAPSRVPALLDYVAARPGGWAWLSFLLVPTTPLFVGLTKLPITTNFATQGLHVSNLQVSEQGGGLVFGNAPTLGEEGLCAVAGSTLSVAVAAGGSASLSDLTGQALAEGSAQAGATNVAFSLAGRPYGYYTASASGKRAKASVGALHLPAGTACVGLIDLVLAQPADGSGTAAAFPLPPLQPAGSGAAPAKVTPKPVSLTLAFAPRDTVWQYYVVSKSPGAKFAQNLQISGAAAGAADTGGQGEGVSFKKSAQPLPNGDQAVLFESEVGLTLMRRSTYAFKLSGQRLGPDGSRSPIRVDRLPVAPPTPVWPEEGGDALGGRSEIYVYV